MGILLPGAGSKANRVLTTVRRRLRPLGWELRRTDPDRSPYLRINCVLDAGAGRGGYGTFLRENGYEGQIISFEPVAASFQSLAIQCARDPKWRAHP
jgi:hypothetical protein